MHSFTYVNPLFSGTSDASRKLAGANLRKILRLRAGGLSAEAGFDPSHPFCQQNREEAFGKSRSTLHHVRPALPARFRNRAWRSGTPGSPSRSPRSSHSPLPRRTWSAARAQPSTRRARRHSIIALVPSCVWCRAIIRPRRTRDPAYTAGLRHPLA
jgi:hypothetical protein